MVLQKLLYAAGVDFALQLAAGAVAIALSTEKFYDLVGSATYLLLAYYTFPATGGNARQIVLTGCVVAARTYLAVFLFSRVLQHGGDSRFVKAKRDWRVFLFFWIMQGVWVFVTVLPMLVTNLTPRRIAMGGKDYAALALVVFGLGFEIVADMQKTAFRSNPHNADKFIDSGLWSVSRHPNYFGEIVLWVGIYLLSMPVLRGWQHVAILSPIFTAWLLMRLSGVPILERQAEKRWGESAAYQAYRGRTAVLVPFIY